jgi:hypothetical protein
MKRIVTLVGMLALVGCSSRLGTVEAKLQVLADCSEVESAIRSAALRDMNQRLDQQLDNALQRNQQYCWMEGDGYAANAGGGSPGSPPAPTSGPSSSGQGASQVSGTNNQVAGVDEADFIKNDNRYIYVVSGGAFRIIEAWPAPGTHEIARVAIEGVPKRLYVYRDRALVYSSLDASPERTSGSAYSQECTYGYHCEFTGDGKPTKVTVFDITDRSAPVVVRELRLSTSYVNSRRVEAAVHTVVTSPGVSFPGLRYWPQNLSYCDTSLTPWEIIMAFEALRIENTRIILETPLTAVMPSVVDTIYEGGVPRATANLLGDCEGFYANSVGDGTSFITLLSVDMTQAETPTFATIVSRPGAVYASPTALYLSVPHDRNQWGEWYASASGFEQASDVHKFALSTAPAAARYAASGVVKGRVLNQFSMDEYQGNLRIATTMGYVPSSNVHSTLTILNQVGPGLYPVGILDNLAPKEDIRSVRFDGWRGYIVTFKKTDPLFVLDLDDPARPRVLAELKIPGFSTYMHMMDETHLLTIGYDAADQGSFAWFTGVLLQIFDVTVPTVPVLAHRHVIGTRGSSSEALTNHLAFNYFAPMNLLALPMTVCEGGNSGGGYGTQMTFSGLMVFDLTAAEGFSEHGRVSHPASATGCSNWWTNANSEVQRSIIMDNYVFSVSQTLIKVNRLDDLPNDLVTLRIAP